MVIAVIMAGGKGTRMRSNQEKPLLEVLGQPLIQNVVDAIFSSEYVETVMVATSIHTPQTARWVKNKGLASIDTPGRGYVEDMAYILSRPDLHDKIILTVTADLPLLTGEVVDEVIQYYLQCQKPALSVMVPVEIFYKHCLQPSMVWENLVPSGLNILRGKDTEQDEELLVLGKLEVALNINSPEDIISLKKLGMNSCR
ncbi:GTP--adenosylcobinamide-phosphate guanylyltransferase [Methanobacterium sp. CWC-01]|jgi:adenosylcobinamide-phosphate guanylyltransferase|uniref:NTP transferase domain-containing protein n=1 Tax=Methanobacterium aridiramus TaxID=2584467 RepID=UPI002575B397|nr:NTP transferase domain-containing protein [Methanobacterium sp. CWC-01]WJI09772.1 GTP--adenosylcobinamide-phosphate guanylyltransferase [Methanobacterium sp. CWC-01]